MLRRTTEANEAEDSAAAEVAGRMIEFARMQAVLRATGRAISWAPVKAALTRDADATLNGLRIKARPTQVFNLIANITFALVVATGLVFVTGQRLDIVGYIIVVAISARMLMPLSLAPASSAELDNCLVAMRSMHTILDAKPLPEPDAESAQHPHGSTVQLDDVSFAYETGQPVLDGVSFTAHEGQVTALVGPSGVGKSSILRLIARFWDVNAGAVRIDGVDVRSVPTAQLMDEVSMVFQETYLFGTSIRENLRLAKPDASDEELAQAARMARLDQVIESLPRGWDTNVCPAGQSLACGR